MAISERAREAAKVMNEKGKMVYIQWIDGVPTCPNCFEKIGKTGDCPCGVKKHPDPDLKDYLQCFDMDFDSFKKEAERANKRYDEKKKKEAEQARKTFSTAE